MSYSQIPGFLWNKGMQNVQKINIFMAYWGLHPQYARLNKLKKNFFKASSIKFYTLLGTKSQDSFSFWVSSIFILGILYIKQNSHCGKRYDSKNHLKRKCLWLLHSFSFAKAFAKPCSKVNCNLYRQDENLSQNTWTECVQHDNRHRQPVSCHMQATKQAAVR